MWSVVKVHMAPPRGLRLKAGIPCYKHVAPLKISGSAGIPAGQSRCGPLPSLPARMPALQGVSLLFSFVGVPQRGMNNSLETPQFPLYSACH